MTKTIARNWENAGCVLANSRNVEEPRSYGVVSGAGVERTRPSSSLGLAHGDR